MSEKQARFLRRFFRCIDMHRLTPALMRDLARVNGVRVRFIRRAQA